MSAKKPDELHRSPRGPAATPLEDQFPHDAETLARLKLTDAQFGNLAMRYQALNRSIHRIEAHVDAASDAYLSRLKKQRLLLLDAIALRIEEAERKWRKAADLAEAANAPLAVGLFGRVETVDV